MKIIHKFLETLDNSKHKKKLSESDKKLETLKNIKICEKAKLNYLPLQ